ncbi:MAG: TetR/AcrR family transcriptional regulator [Sphaerochaetaceae bacterium]|nr:TetR/AcrR family transcriptional regulator [Sphaerochaetaceae bacterium]
MEIEKPVRVRAEYRSSKRSKALIRNALIALMREKPFEDITVTDIVGRADINRGTFYAHFKSPGDVLDRIQTDAVSELGMVMSKVDFVEFLRNPEPTLKDFSLFLLRDPEYYRMLIEINRGVIVREWKNKLYELFSGVGFITSGLRENRELDWKIAFLVNGIIETYLDALQESKELSLKEAPKQIANIINLLMKE